MYVCVFVYVCELCTCVCVCIRTCVCVWGMCNCVYLCLWVSVSMCLCVSTFVCLCPKSTTARTSPQGPGSKGNTVLRRGTRPFPSGLLRTRSSFRRDFSADSTLDSSSDWTGTFLTYRQGSATSSHTFPVLRLRLRHVHSVNFRSYRPRVSVLSSSHPLFRLSHRESGPPSTGVPSPRSR